MDRIRATNLDPRENSWRTACVPMPSRLFGSLRGKSEMDEWGLTNEIDGGDGPFEIDNGSRIHPLDTLFLPMYLFHCNVVHKITH